MSRFQKGNPGGPGRPRKADQNAGAVARAEKKIRDRLPEIVDAMIELALGVVVDELNPVTNQRMVYQKPPDRGAGQYLMDRIMGKPTERHEHTGEDGGDIRIQTFTRALDVAYSNDSTSDDTTEEE